MHNEYIKMFENEACRSKIAAAAATSALGHLSFLQRQKTYMYAARSIRKLGLPAAMTRWMVNRNQALTVLNSLTNKSHMSETELIPLQVMAAAYARCIISVWNGVTSWN